MNIPNDPFALLANPAITRAFVPLEGAVPGQGDPQRVEESFAASLRNVITETSDLQLEAQNAIEAFVNGEEVELHQVMAAVEEAQIALEILTETRNRLIDGYRTIVNMQ